MLDESDLVCDEESDGQGKFNVRFDFGEIEHLASSILEAGRVNRPLDGRMGADGKFHVTDGERRLLAVRHIKKTTGTNILLPCKPEPSQRTAHGSTSGLPEDQRIVQMLVGNSGKPFNLLEQGRAFARLVGAGWNMKRIGTATGCSDTNVADCLRLVNETHPLLQELVVSGRMSATTAVEIVKSEPDIARQAIIGQEASENAGEGKRITAAHVPVHIGKERHAAAKTEAAPHTTPDPVAPRPPELVTVDKLMVEQTGSTGVQSKHAPDTSSTDFNPAEEDAAQEEEIERASAASAPSTPDRLTAAPKPSATDPANKPTGNARTVELDIPKSAKVTAMYTVSPYTNGRFYCNYEIASSLVGTKHPDPWKESFDTDEAATLAALQAMLGFAHKQKTAKGGADWKVAAGELKACIKVAEDRLAPKPKPARPATAAPAPATPPKLDGRVAEFVDLFESLDRRTCEFARYDTASAIYLFLKGGCTYLQLSQFILGISQTISPNKPK